jgi:hypothetical protein
MRACDAAHKQTDRLSRGDAFGDLALMTGEPHFATYRAASKCGVQLLVMSQALFETYMDAGVSKQAQVLLIQYSCAFKFAVLTNGRSAYAAVLHVQVLFIVHTLDAPTRMHIACIPV